MNEQEKLCTLCMDELSLKTNLFYDVKNDRIVGLEDFGCGARTNKVANQALVRLLQSISGKWKQPLGNGLVNGGCPREEMEELMKELMLLIKLKQLVLTFLLLCQIWAATFKV